MGTRMFIFPGMFLLLFAAAFIITLLFLAYKHPNRRISFAIAITIAILLLASPFVLYLSRARTAPVTVEPILESPQAIAHDHSPSPVDVGESWNATNATSDAWPQAPGLADKYPSDNLMLPAIAKWAADILTESNDNTNIVVHVSGLEHKHFHTRLGNLLSAQDPNIRVNLNRSIGNPNQLIIKEIPSPDDSKPQPYAVSLTTTGQQHAISASVIKTDWVADPTEYRNLNWVVVFNSDLYTSEADAINALRPVAIHQLKQRIATTANRVPPHLINQAVDQAVAEGRYAFDTFTQRIQRPYGNLYRAALSIQHNPGSDQYVLQRTNEIQRYVNTAQAQRRESIAGSAVGFFLLIALICAIYAVLNTLTKGYYRGTISTGLVIFGVAAGLFMLMFIA